EILSGADTLSVTVAADGSLAAALGPQPAGEWTLLLDGDRDGFYQPWSDLLLPLSITPAVQVTGLTVHTESSERLNFSWTPLTNAPQGTVYRVEAAVSPAFSLPLTLATTADTTWTDSLSVPAMPLRLYRVKAVMP
ncbi:MAG: hypothetical protein KC488_16090, partial [Candidatus Cloacimonetes bacterium]|nr:hypothetical protein [Candidatus Cloacimonadota bacterium]